MMQTIKISTDKLQTYLGLFEAVLVAGISYIASLTPEGLNLKSPVFWGGLTLAISRAVKGFYAAGVKAEVVTPPATETQKAEVVIPQPQASDAVKPMVIAMLVIGLAGCSSLKGTMLDGTVCTIASEANNTVLTDQIIQTYVNKADQDKAQAYLLTAKLGSTALCEMLRARQAVQAQGNPVQGPVAPVNPS